MKNIGPSWRDQMIGASLKEAAGCVSFLRKGKDLETWTQMEQSEMLEFVPGDAHNCLRLLKKWNVCLTGFMADAFTQPVPSRSEQLPDAVRAMLQQEEEELASMEAVENHLLKNYGLLPIPADQPLHIGHLLHGMVRICKKVCPFPWTNHASIIDVGGNAATMVYFMQPNPLLHLGVVHSESHWALAVLEKATQVCVLYDGKDNPVCEERARKWAEGWDSDIAFHKAATPYQPDDFSCGQRVLLATDFILRCVYHGLAGPPKALPLDLPADFASKERLQALTHLIPKSKSEPFLNCKQEHPSAPRAKPNPTSSAPAHPARSASPPPPSVPSPPPSPPASARPASKRRRLEEQPETDVADKPDAAGEADEHEVAADRKIDGKCTPPRRRRAPLPEDSPPGQMPKTTAAAKRKKLLTEKVAAVTEKIEGNGLEHNDAFQKRHATLKIAPKRGHWKTFLENLAEGKRLHCKACESLAQEFYFADQSSEEWRPGGRW